MKIDKLFSIEDKIVIITGCSSGIGLELAKVLFQMGLSYWYFKI